MYNTCILNCSAIYQILRRKIHLSNEKNRSVLVNRDDSRYFSNAVAKVSYLASALLTKLPIYIVKVKSKTLQNIRPNHSDVVALKRRSCRGGD